MGCASSAEPKPARADVSTSFHPLLIDTIDEPALLSASSAKIVPTFPHTAAVEAPAAAPLPKFPNLSESTVQPAQPLVLNTPQNVSLEPSSHFVPFVRSRRPIGAAAVTPKQQQQQSVILPTNANDLSTLSVNQHLQGSFGEALNISTSQSDAAPFSPHLRPRRQTPAEGSPRHSLSSRHGLSPSLALSLSRDPREMALVSLTRDPRDPVLPPASSPASVTRDPRELLSFLQSASRDPRDPMLLQSVTRDPRESLAPSTPRGGRSGTHLPTPPTLVVNKGGAIGDFLSRQRDEEQSVRTPTTSGVPTYVIRPARTTAAAAAGSPRHGSPSKTPPTVPPSTL